MVVDDIVRMCERAVPFVVEAYFAWRGVGGGGWGGGQGGWSWGVLRWGGGGVAEGLKTVKQSST